MRTVVFDLDGTLADTSADLIAAANACFDAPMLDPVADAGTAFRGGRAMLKLGFERLGAPDVAAAVEAQYHPFLDRYADHIDVFTQLYPGTVAAVERLRAEGYATAICTNKPAGLAETLMARLRVRDLFDALVGADTLPVRKPDPAPYLAAVERAGGTLNRSMLIGDTVTDRDTARAAGVPCALVTFGPDGHGVADLQPEALLDHYDGLFALVDQMID
ncbi:haloacid dehalogenase [Actibacterium mucosum KCTC 23349]|uniref:phosphoglycolate phosphatase n=1 Tax=Actibacterium mucosum KCTC 23349 TaxID=1454373 RepID=A0A037ZIX0_9RHOB|nr:HAD-IA family hydrolase [Actibacterium mucosum]KAJ55579.1 haloacid dehalogenase [Actibacterium mucosum KCTC 23349]